MSDTPRPDADTPPPHDAANDASPSSDETNDAADIAGDAAPSDDAPALPSVEEFQSMRDAMLRAVAEADNVRKQAAKEIADSRKYAIASFARDLLSVADNFERALKSLPEDVRAQLGDAGQSLLTGVEMTEKELHTVLARHGVETIAAQKGAKFDPNVHQAAAQIPSDQPKDTIAEVIQAGWRMGERTLRPAMVAVSSGAPAAPPASDGDGQSEGGADPDEPGQRIDTTI